MSSDEMSLRDHLGQLLREMGNLSEAETMFRQLKADCEQRLGTGSPFTFAVTNQLALTLQRFPEQEKKLEADRLHRDLVKRRAQACGERSPDALQSMSNLGDFLLRQWREGATDVLSEAKTMSLRALEGRRDVLGVKDPRTLYTASTLALLLSSSIPQKANSAEVQRAEQLHEEAASGLLQRLGPSHPVSLLAMKRRAEHWLLCAEVSRDEDLCRRAHDELSNVLGKQIVKLGKEHDQTQETKDLVHKSKTLLATLEKNLTHSDLTLLQHTNVEQEFRPWREFHPEIFPYLNTAEHFASCRKAIREYGLYRLMGQLQELGFVDYQERLTTTTKPFNVFARIAAGELKQENMVADQHFIGKHQDRFLVACNRPECDENWESADPAWLGKASMAKHHKFLTTKDLHWKWFNVLVFGMLDNMRESIEFLESMHEAAVMYVTKKGGWPTNVGFFFHVYALSSVNSLHLHMVDMENCGPTYHKMEHKNLSIQDALHVLKQELQEGF